MCKSRDEERRAASSNVHLPFGMHLQRLRQSRSLHAPLHSRAKRLCLWRCSSKGNAEELQECVRKKKSAIQSPALSDLARAVFLALSARTRKATIPGHVQFHASRLVRSCRMDFSGSSTAASYLPILTIRAPPLPECSGRC